MLLVKTKLGPSSINGIGCFADEDIKAGTVIWELNERFDVVMSAEEKVKLPPIAKEHMDHFAYVNALEGGFVLCGDNAKYFNHSHNPNCEAAGRSTIASVDIKRGEEITENYFTFDAQAEYKLSH